jgi:hypothetical protein
MNEDRLRALIEHADAEPPAPEISSHALASRVRVLYRRRRRRRLAIAAAALLLCGVLLWQRLPGRQTGQLAGPTPPAPAIPAAEVAGAAEHLRAAVQQVEREEQIVEYLLAVERLRRLSDTARNMKPAVGREEFLDEQVGRAATAILLSGDRNSQRPEDISSARKDYACVVQLFPNTVWAERAKERLAALGEGIRD